MSQETELSASVQVPEVCETNDNEIVQESKILNEEHVSPSKICSNKQITVLQVIDCNKIKEIDNSETCVEISKEQSDPVIANESDDDDLENSLNEREDSVTIKPKKLRIIDSDSEDEVEGTQTNRAEDKEQSNDSKVYDINNKGELVPEGDSKHKIAMTNLCDSESDEEIENSHTNNFDSENVEPIKYKKKPKKKDSEMEPKKMTAKEAAEQRKEIESDSQRRVREKHVSLPYHVPKQRTLQEFMKFRKRFASTVPKEAGKKSASLAIKMTAEQLKIVSKNLKEREKEVEEFFKSESEEEDDEEPIETNKDCDEVVEEKAESELNEINSVIVESSEITDDTTVQTQDAKSNEESAPIEIPVAMDTEENIENTKNDQVDSNVMETVDKPVENTNESIEDNLNNSSGSSNSMNLVFNLDDEFDDEMDCEMVNEVPKENEETVVEKTTNRDLLKQQFANSIPCLSGGPNSVIDLDEGVTRPDDVSLLMERFARHACKKTPQKHKIELNITSVSGAGDIHKEKLAVKIDDAEEPEINERPGVRMEKLRNDLQIQMAQKRVEMWKQRAKPPTKDEDMDTYEGEKDSCGADDDILDDDEEEELTETEDEEDEEEALAKEATKDETKCEFFEEEADESDPEEESSDEELEPDDGEKKPLKRIIKPFGDDSDEEVVEEITEIVKVISPVPKTVGNEDDESPPAAQPHNNEKTPIRPKILPKADFGFLTPVNRLTCLQNFDSKRAIDSPGSPALKLVEPSPLKSINWHKKLFLEPDNQNTQQNIEELATICSGKFQTQQNTTNEESKETEPIVEVATTTQELLDLCSGQFTGATQKVDGSSETESATLNESSKAKPTVETITLGAKKEIKNLGDDNEDKFISQLLDEEEMEKFKRRLDTPEKSQRPKNYFNETDDENEDEDANDTAGQKKKKFRKRKTKALVDSEDDEDEDVGNEEECIDLHDEDDNEEVEVEYDSEENEIEVAKTKDAPKKMKTSDFFENEAELSESEWGSADEDEKDLDQFEVELGDKEKFDENKVRSDLEKIHMRRLLDDDNREVKILQEMLLEDGELQGTGRQRQFRWKNIDNQTGEENPGNAANDEDGAIDEDEEDEEQWRKKRYEREVFLRNSQNSQGSSKESDVTLKSQVLKLGQKAIIRNQNMSMQVKDDKVKVKKTFSLLNQRGSFLSRGAQVLARVAEYTKVSNPVTGGAKNSRNFVFQTVNVDPDEPVKKRKAPAGETPTAIKKIRLENFSPAVGKKDSGNSKKKLFGNW